MTDALLFGTILTTVMNILKVAVGLGLVIFFHELGHFAVAKWCNVYVERFSIGFGRPLLSWKWGETEYWLAILPLGGYVKMLGQDDMDPSQLTSEEIAEDPRAYSAKSVPQRMAIISAGVIMNIITAMLFYGTAYGMGVETASSTVGSVRVGMPAWQAGLRTGWKITHINGTKVESFMDIRRMVALTRGDLVIEGVKPDGSTFKETITPDGSGTRQQIGVLPISGTQLIKPRESDDIQVTIPGFPAHKATPPFKSGDVITRIDETRIDDYVTMQRVLSEKRDAKITFHVVRAEGGEEVAIPVERNPFRTLGLWMTMHEIAAIRKGSPADGKLKPGDVITHVDGEAIGETINPMRLPDLFEQLARENKTTTLTVRRKGSKDGEPVAIAFTANDTAVPAWTEQPIFEDVPLSIPSLGVAFHMIAVVQKVEEGSPAAKAGIKVDEKNKPKLTKMVLTLPEGAEEDFHNKNEPVVIEFGKKKDDRVQHNWAYAFWMMQSMPTRTVTLTFADESEYSPTPREEADWSLPFRGIRPQLKLTLQQAEGPWSALKMGIGKGKDTIFDVYLTLARLFGGQLSYKELSGPVKIAEVAYKVADHGFPDFLIFLGFLSINLAVLNFLPIPVLDGGHMVFLIWEAVTRKKPSEKVMIGATYIGLAIVLGLMVLVLYLDIFVKR